MTQHTPSISRILQLSQANLKHGYNFNQCKWFASWESWLGTKAKLILRKHKWKKWVNLDIWGATSVKIGWFLKEIRSRIMDITHANLLSLAVSIHLLSLKRSINKVYIKSCGWSVKRKHMLTAVIIPWTICPVLFLNRALPKVVVWLRRVCCSLQMHFSDCTLFL